jgi:hypothetical protein
MNADSQPKSWLQNNGANAELYLSIAKDTSNTNVSRCDRIQNE